MRKRKIGLYDIGSLAVTPTVDQPRQSLKRFQREEETRIKAEQAAKEEAVRVRLVEIEAPLKAEAQEHSRRLKLYWSRPLSDISVNGLEIALVDFVGDYEIGPRDTEKENTAWSEFKDNLKSCGCVLSEDGGLRLSWFLSSLAFRRGVSLTSVENFAKALERLHSLQVFPAGELTGYRTSETVEQPRTTQTEVNPLDELETLTLESRRDNARGKEIVEGLVGAEQREAWNQFITQLYEDTGHMLTNHERLAIFNTMKRRGLDIRNSKHFRLAVVALAHTGEVSDKILSPQDKLDAFIETANLQDYSVRQEINRRQRAINETAERKRLGF